MLPSCPSPSPTRATTLRVVDSLGIASTCKGDCLEDAAAFVAMMNEDATFLKILLPGGKQPPLYLLPARATVNPALDGAAPLYPKLRSVIERAVAVPGSQLGRQLRAMGKVIRSGTPR